MHFVFWVKRVTEINHLKEDTNVPFGCKGLIRSSYTVRVFFVGFYSSGLGFLNNYGDLSVLFDSHECGKAKLSFRFKTGNEAHLYVALELRPVFGWPGGGFRP